MNFKIRESDMPDHYWRSLHYYNLYRLVIGGVFSVSFVLFGATLSFGEESPLLFFLTSIFYVAICVVSIITISLRWPGFKYQLAFQVVSDIVLIVALMHASGGEKSGLGLLLVASLAAGSLISRGKMALFFAAFATIVVLLEQLHRVLFLNDSSSDFLHSGLLSISFFATAWLARTLAKYATASEDLAKQRGIDLANLAQVNQLVIQDMQDGVLVVDENGIIRQSNTQAEKMLGVVIHKQRDLDLADYSPPLAAYFRHWCEDHEAVFEPLRIQANGKQIKVRFVPLGGEKTIGALIFLENVSIMQAQAQQIKLAALGRLTANIAHEIRNPLSAIGHATQLLQEEEGMDKTQSRMLQIIRDNTFRLDRMVQDVLQLNRRDRAEIEQIPAENFLRSFVEDFCQVEKIPSAAISLEIDSDQTICFDRSHLNQVLWNLCRNAWRHCQKQDASIRLCVTEAHIENIIQLDVIDDGAGVSVEMQPQLFEPFSTTENQGTGLGLYIAKEICEANGASLDYIEVAPGGQFRICCKGGTC
ncbi:sensor histidine kinase [Sulfurirhabdus autotrophica]|uniref:sensor histidine kinase n=1 Tax=Sulfurirhabdus autotrophica TaxID=1706046 RepID=UPI001404B68F|nr:ATP-binding protein [Sulfurirhabdus autotrophica]